VGGGAGHSLLLVGWLYRCSSLLGCGGGGVAAVVHLWAVVVGGGCYCLSLVVVMASCCLSSVVLVVGLWVLLVIHGCLWAVIPICAIFKVVDGDGVIHNPHSWVVGCTSCHLGLWFVCDHTGGCCCFGWLSVADVDVCGWLWWQCHVVVMVVEGQGGGVCGLIAAAIQFGNKFPQSTFD
jgi:hypothetical protein